MISKNYEEEKINKRENKIQWDIVEAARGVNSAIGDGCKNPFARVGSHTLWCHIDKCSDVFSIFSLESCKDLWLWLYKGN